MCVISVFSGDSRSPIWHKTVAACSRSPSASALVPETTRHQSSAYADVRVMPTVAVNDLVAGVSALGGSA